MRAGGGFSNYHAYIYADGVVTNLNSLIPAGSGLHLPSPRASTTPARSSARPTTRGRTTMPSC